MEDPSKHSSITKDSLKTERNTKVSKSDKKWRVPLTALLGYGANDVTRSLGRLVLLLEDSFTDGARLETKVVNFAAGAEGVRVQGRCGVLATGVPVAGVTRDVVLFLTESGSQCNVGEHGRDRVKAPRLGTHAQ